MDQLRTECPHSLLILIIFFLTYIECVSYNCIDGSWGIDYPQLALQSSTQAAQIPIHGANLYKLNTTKVQTCPFILYYKKKSLG